MPVRLFLPPVIFGLGFLLIVSTGDALLWDTHHALERFPARAVTVGVLTGLWLLRAYKRSVR